MKSNPKDQPNESEARYDEERGDCIKDEKTINHLILANEY